MTLGGVGLAIPEIPTRSLPQRRLTFIAKHEYESECRRGRYAGLLGMDGTTRSLTPDQRPHFDSQDLDLIKQAAECHCPMDLREMCDGWKESGHPDIESATALLYDRILRRCENRLFLESVLNLPEKPQMDSVVVGIVPGAFYREHKHTGADGARIAIILQEIGLSTEVVPVHSFGRVEENALIINGWLRAQKADHVLLVTLSKGGADVKTALRMGGGASWGRVRAWINLSGLVQGTPLIMWLRRQPLRMAGVRFLLWLRGQSFAAADDLRHGEESSITDWPPLPKSLRLIHVLAFPLRRHLRHRWAFRAYKRLGPLGPNDGGGILLEDAARLPGIICPLWGLDHYLEPDWDAAPLLRNILLASLAPNADTMLVEDSRSSCEPTVSSAGLT